MREGISKAFFGKYQTEFHQKFLEGWLDYIFGEIVGQTPGGIPTRTSRRIDPKKPQHEILKESQQKYLEEFQ